MFTWGQSYLAEKKGASVNLEDLISIDKAYNMGLLFFPCLILANCLLYNTEWNMMVLVECIDHVCTFSEGIERSGDT